MKMVRIWIICVSVSCIFVQSLLTQDLILVREMSFLKIKRNEIYNIFHFFFHHHCVPLLTLVSMTISESESSPSHDMGRSRSLLAISQCAPAPLDERFFLLRMLTCNAIIIN